MKIHEMEIEIKYPSGASATLKGMWHGVQRVSEDTYCLALDVTETGSFMGNRIAKGTVFVGDPRGIYIDKMTGKVIYHPRRNWPFKDAFSEWLEENPAWAQLESE